MGLFTDFISYRNATGAYLMLALPLLAFLFFWLQWKRQEALQSLCGTVLADTLSKRRSPFLVIFKATLLCLCWMLATLALMDPYKPQREPHEVSSKPQNRLPRKRLAQDVIILIDASASMEIADGPAGETRLEFAKEIADDLIARLQGQSVALYAFTSALVPEVPPTWDYLYTRLILRDIAINPNGTAGTDFLPVLKALKAEMKENRGQHAISLVLFSDGDDTDLAILQGAAKQQRLTELTHLVAEPETLQVLTIGMGTAKGGDVPDITFQGQPVHSSLNGPFLEALSHQHGLFYEANDFSSFDLSQRLISQIERNTRYEMVQSTPQNRDQEESPSLYQFPLMLAILTLVGAVLLPEIEPEKH